MSLHFLRFPQTPTVTVAVRARCLAQFRGAIVIVLLCTTSAQGRRAVESAHNFLRGQDFSVGALDLDKCRPRPVSPDEKRKILESLAGVCCEVKKLDKRARETLVSLERVLRAHERQSVYELKVVEASQARVGTYHRAVVLIPRPVIYLLTPEELQATVAHEIGHDYVWAEYQLAEKRKDNVRLRQLELFCDAVAIVTLRRVGVEPINLIRALMKLDLANQEFGSARDDRYPSLAERKNFAHAIMGWVTEASQAASQNNITLPFPVALGFNFPTLPCTVPVPKHGVLATQLPITP